jgi:hypothetical protein
MRQLHNSHRLIITICLALFIAPEISAQTSPIDWSMDTLSKSDALGRRDTYLNTIRGSGQKATARVNMPVDKLKAIIDACAARGIPEVSFLMTVIRPQDVARYRRNHPSSTATDEQIKGSQLVIIRVKRSAFTGSTGNKSSSLSNNASMVSLLSMGLILLDQPYGMDGTDEDIYFDLGLICPPPASCD